MAILIAFRAFALYSTNRAASFGAEELASSQARAAIQSSAYLHTQKGQFEAPSGFASVGLRIVDFGIVLTHCCLIVAAWHSLVLEPVRFSSPQGCSISPYFAPLSYGLS